ncbi:MAG: efflux RND transporter periplasmic adaptor subunit [Verrucomicrobia bacterium]|jgi:multidrug resistance efflux pump|nr:efflux RND transporter periplasmic adaptor subunit [Verrucomicrobiota bacterium]|tara:strand:- start:5834 stop:7225 length:1392 start_codon:yes stop_codon:yes gene_type:complete
MSTTGQLFETTEAPKSAKVRLGVWLLPLGILAGFALLFALLFRDRLLPAKTVEVFPAVGIEEKTEAKAAPQKSSSSTGSLLFQASGWIEPDPLPIKATALTDGIVDEVYVLEGELVKKGDLLATLIEVDTRIERDLMAAKLGDMKASFDAHCVGTQIALQKMEIEKSSLTIAEADAAEAENKLLRYERMSKGSITEDERISVRFDHTRSLAEVDAAKARIAGIAEDLNQIAYQVLAIQSRIKGAETDLEKAELAYSRTKITAPADGRVLALMAAPGQKKMAGMDAEDSSTIAILYDPEHLQVRVDVPLGDAAGLGVGQRAKIRCNLLPDMIFEGEVTRIEGSADLQRNTLQAKVRIENPSKKLRPEMLCRVEFFETFLETESTGTSVDNSMGIVVYVPVGAVSDGTAWICDSDSMRAEKRSVETSAVRENLIRVNSGIRPGEWVVSNPSGLKSGQRLNPLFPD